MLGGGIRFISFIWLLSLCHLFNLTIEAALLDSRKVAISNKPCHLKICGMQKEVLFARLNN